MPNGSFYRRFCDDTSLAEREGLHHRVGFYNQGTPRMPRAPRPPASEASPSTFLLPPSMVDAPTRSPEGSPEREVDDIGVINAQLLQGGFAAFSPADVHRAYVDNNRDVVNTILHLEDWADGAVRPTVASTAGVSLPDVTPDQSDFLAGSLMAALARMHASSVASGGPFEGDAPGSQDEAADSQPLHAGAAETSQLQQLVGRFIDEWNDTSQELAPNEFTCPISLLAMRQPVCAGDGHLYDRAHIEKAFRCSKEGVGGVISPMTRAKLAEPEQTQLFPCYAVASLMEKWVRERVKVAGGDTLESALTARYAVGH